MKVDDILINRLTDICRVFFDQARASHGWDHVQRVTALCQTMGPMEGCDMTVLLASALLHDIARRQCDMEKGARCHARVGAQMAREILAGLNLDERFIGQVVHCVATHRYRGDDRPESMEARVLFDADKLDSIGAVGVGRAFQFAGEVGAMLHDPDIDPGRTAAYGPDDTAWREYMVKLRHIKEAMLTTAGAAIASERSRFMDEFFHRLNREARGEI